ncbi:MAG: polyprenyl synthetase family protein, partial [Actinomycetota bacterium]
MLRDGRSLDQLRTDFDAVLRSFLHERRATVPDAKPLLDEIERALRAGGKRLRPTLCYWGFKAAGGSHGNEILRAAASLELLHTFAVVHDDIMDAALE